MERDRGWENQGEKDRAGAEVHPNGREGGWIEKAITRKNKSARRW